MTIVPHASHVVHVTNIKYGWSMNPGQVKKMGLMDSCLTCSTSSQPILSIRISYFTSYLISFHRQASWGPTPVHICMFLPPLGSRVALEPECCPEEIDASASFYTFAFQPLMVWNQRPYHQLIFLVWTGFLVDKEDVDIHTFDSLSNHY